MLKLIIIQPIPKIISIKHRVKLKLKSILSSSFDKLKDLDVTRVEIVIRIINSITTLANKKKPTPHVKNIRDVKFIVFSIILFY